MARSGSGSWFRAMPLEVRIALIAAMRLLAEVRERNPGQFDDLREESIRAAPDAARALGLALVYAARYAGDDSREARRIVMLCRQVADIINEYIADDVRGT